MSTHEKNQTSRRGFLGSVATGAAAMGIATFTGPLQKLHASPGIPHISNPDDDPEQVFKSLTGKHRIVFDVVKPNGMMPFAWPRVFLMTNMGPGMTEKDINAVVILRHDGIPYAFNDDLWKKYNFGEMFELTDENKKPLDRNPFWKPAPGTYKVPGIGVVQIGINELQDSGVKFVLCNAATTVFSAAAAQKMGMKEQDCYNEWKAAILPGITLVPSGVWAVGRAQENKCAYCYAS
ncbi:MAG TPA: twin-arginine translocation signal domain-containing protein [Chitinophagaceae bacterium]|jgi:intracellular sulfur oxidation DsrE/DsrF family protein